MPELPDLTVYLEALERHVVGQKLDGARVLSPFVVRTFEPNLSELAGRTAVATARVGKRLALGFEGDLWLCVHLMVAGRLRWKKPGAALSRKLGLAAFDFADGCLLLTEASQKKRAAIHLLPSREALSTLDAGGIEPLEITRDEFAERLAQRNHTLKRALTDPHIFAGIGNAYSDEMLHRAQLSPVQWTSRLTEQQVSVLFEAMQQVLREWTQRHREALGKRFPDKVTAFHDAMAVHGKYGQPCPRCQTPVQRIRRADNEVNYCPRCQTAGKLLADRSLSRLLKGDWPKTLDELEEYKAARRI